MALAAKHVPRLTGYCFARSPAGGQRASRLPSAGVISASADPRRCMATLPEELEGWDDLDERERERLRELFRDLGLHLDVPGDPDAFE